MPISRMDIMTMAPKTNEATGYKVAENQKPVNEQAALSSNIQKTVNHNNQQTIRKANADNPEYRYDAKEKGNNQYSGNRKKKSKKQEEEEKTEQGFIGERHIDISI